MRLYSFFRSSAAYRVRIALNVKGVAYETISVDLPGAEHRTAEFRAVNPQATIPTLDDDGTVLWQSLAIIEYLDARFPSPRLIPAEPVARARVQALAQLIACEIHPLNNLRVLKYLKHTVGVTDEAKDAWYRHWIELGFESLQANLARSGKAGRFCFGDTPTLADICLVPQVFNAQRFNVDVSRYPAIAKIYEACMEMEAFRKAEPKSQPDAE